MDENEKLKFELEKQKLEFEKEKLEFERKKFEESSMKTQLPLNNLEEKSKISIALIIFKIINIIATIVLVASVFAPWFSSEGSGYGQSYKQEIDGLKSGHGYYIIVFAIACLVLIIIRNKFSFIPAFLALTHGLYIISGVGEYKISAYGVSGRIGYEEGPIIVVIASLVIILFSLFSFIKFNKNNSIPKKKLSEKSKRNWLVLSFVISTTIHHNLFFDSNWSFEDLFLIIVSYTISLFFLKKLKINRSFNLYLTGSLILIIVFSFLIINPYRNNNLFESILLANTIFYFAFFILFYVLFIYELKNLNQVEKFNSKWFKIFRPISLILIFFIPLISFFTFYSITRHNITDDEYANFKTNNSFLNGEWYFFNADSTDFYTIQINFQEGQRYNTGEIDFSFSAYIQQKGSTLTDPQGIVGKNDYDFTQTLPLKFDHGLQVNSIKDTILSGSVELNGNTILYNATKNKSYYENIINKKDPFCGYWSSIETGVGGIQITNENGLYVITVMYTDQEPFSMKRNGNRLSENNYSLELCENKNLIFEHGYYEDKILVKRGFKIADLNHNNFIVQTSNEISKANLVISDNESEGFISAVTESYNNGIVDFSGHYITAEFGCGMACSAMAITDVETGQVVATLYNEAIFDANMDNPEFMNLKLNKNSNLIIGEYANQNKLEYKTRYFLFSEKLKKLFEIK